MALDAGARDDRTRLRPRDLPDLLAGQMRVIYGGVTRGWRYGRTRWTRARENWGLGVVRLVWFKLSLAPLPPANVAVHVFGITIVYVAMAPGTSVGHVSGGWAQRAARASWVGGCGAARELDEACS
jgi:hypothetical protein